MNNSTMIANNAVFGALAECFMTIDGRRYNFMQMTEFERQKLKEKLAIFYNAGCLEEFNN